MNLRPLRPLQHGETQNREDRRRAAVHDRGAESADDPRSHSGVRREPEIVEIFDQREAGADGEAHDRRIHQEADAMRADQRDDHQSLQQFLDHRRHVA